MYLIFENIYTFKYVYVCIYIYAHTRENRCELTTVSTAEIISGLQNSPNNIVIWIILKSKCLEMEISKIVWNSFKKLKVENVEAISKRNFRKERV